MATIQTPQPPQDTERLPPAVTFDDHLWPINLAIVTLASFIAGVVVITGRFDEERQWLNARTHLELLGGATCAAMWIVSRIDRRRFRRGLQLAILMSLIAHLFFLSALRSTPWEALADRITAPPRHFVPLEVVPLQVIIEPREDSGDAGKVDRQRGEPAAIAPTADTAPLVREELSPLEPWSLAGQSIPSLDAEPDSPPDTVNRSPVDEPALEPNLPATRLARQAPRAIQPAELPIEAAPIENPTTENAPAFNPSPSASARTLSATDNRPILPMSSAEPPPTDAAPTSSAMPVRPATETDPPAHRIAARLPMAPRIAAPQLAAPDELPEVETTPPQVAGRRIDSQLRPTAAADRPVSAPMIPSLNAANAPSAPAASSPDAPRILDRREVADENSAVPSTSLLARKLPRAPLIEGRTREPAEAFAKRSPSRQRSAGGDEASRRSEVAIDSGLAFLARQQAADGSWKLQSAPSQGNDQRPSFRSDTAATGLALLAFLGAGYDHYDRPHQRVVQHALDWLIQHQQSTGDLYQRSDAMSNRSAWLYSHGIAAIALCEAYGMTGDASLAAPAQGAIDFIAAAQDAKRGAWRYAPGIGSDTSVSGWQLMALKSGELAGLNVPPGAYQKIKRYLDAAQAPGYQFVYNPAAPDTPQQAHGRRPTASMTAVGLLMRLYTGWNRNDPRMVEGAQHLLAKLPDNGSATQPARDTYYWYYATQVMFHMRGEYWRAWNHRLAAVLTPGQVATGPLSGSWDPLKPIPDRWGPQGGRLYVTTLNLLSLEVAYRHLPIYESTAQ